MSVTLCGDADVSGLLAALNHEAKPAVKLGQPLTKSIEVDHSELLNSTIEVREAL